MSDDKKWLFERDPNRFQKILTTDNVEDRIALMSTPDDLPPEDFLLCEVTRYGIKNDQGMIGPLAALYRELANRLTEDDRFTIFRHVVGFIADTSAVSTNALLPFIAEEKSRMIVSTAVIDYVSLSPLIDNDPMSRVKDITGMIERGSLENRGAAFGALLHVGDKRVCELLIPLRNSLNREDMNEAVKCGTGIIHSATVEFYLDWLKLLKRRGDMDAFGIVASGLLLLRRKAQTDKVATGNRPFPVTGVTEKQWKSHMKLVALEKYVKTISRPMYGLERSEPPPRVMPVVLKEWGLEPRTDPSEVATP